MKCRLPQFEIESLESRRLFSGVTMLIHGYNGSTVGWVNAAASAISERLNGEVSIYTMSVGMNSKDRLAVTSFTLDGGTAMTENSTGEVIIQLDWSAVDDGTYTTAEVGDAVATYLMQRHGATRAMVEMPLHLIGHSRGASLAVAITRDLGQRGVWVDQDTFLDPHPVDGINDMLDADFKDDPMRVYDNVLFADNYWRTDGDINNADPDGEMVDGAHDSNLDQSVQQFFVGSAHLAVTAYYHGTIDPAAVFNGENPINENWYDPAFGQPAKTQTGFAYTRLGAGKRPADGLIPDLGGTASRITAGEIGTQWGNLTSMRILDGSTITAGPRATLRFLREDRDSENSITIFLDKDNNPYNGNNVRTLRRFTLDAATASEASRISIPTDEIAPGTYYLGASINDEDGHLRFAYTSQIEVVAATGASKGPKAAIKPASYFSDAPIAPPIQNTPADSIKRIIDLVL